MDLSELERLTKQNETADVLRRARALVDTPEKWAGGGVRYMTLNNNCSATAIGTASNGESVGKRALNCFATVIVGVTFFDIWHWNDAPERTHADVLAAFDRAIALAESDA